MSQIYGGTSFPFKEDLYNKSLKKDTSINNTIKSAMLVFLFTDPGQRRGNNVGSMLGGLMHQIFTNAELRIKENELKKELSDEFPEAEIIDVKLEPIRTSDELYHTLTISFATQFSDLEELSIKI